MCMRVISHQLDPFSSSAFYFIFLPCSLQIFLSGLKTKLELIGHGIWVRQAR